MYDTVAYARGVYLTLSFYTYLCTNPESSLLGRPSNSLSRDNDIIDDVITRNHPSILDHVACPRFLFFNYIIVSLSLSVLS